MNSLTLKEEKDDARKKLLAQIREIARGASYAYPYPAAKKEEPPQGTPPGTAEPPAAAQTPAAPEKGGEPGIEKTAVALQTPAVARDSMPADPISS